MKGSIEFKRAGFLLDMSSERTQPFLYDYYMEGEPLDCARWRLNPFLFMFIGRRTPLVWFSHWRSHVPLQAGDETYETLIRTLSVIVAYRTDRSLSRASQQLSHRFHTSLSMEKRL
jgi:hypothetical protein